jgi:hypothetical protein
MTSRIGDAKVNVLYLAATEKLPAFTPRNPFKSFTRDKKKPFRFIGTAT